MRLSYGLGVMLVMFLFGCRDQATASRTLDEVVTPPASLLVPDTQNPLIMIFTIPDGLGAKSWNAPATKFELKVGQTWRIVNQDASVPHQLHTGGVPCPHGGTSMYDATGVKIQDGFNADQIPVGGWVDCVLKAAIDNTDNQIYDHFQLSSDDDEGRVYITVAP